jgi:hypothetical protein
MDRACSTHSETIKAYRILVGKLEGKRPLGRPIHRWENNIKIDIIEINLGAMDWIDLAQDKDQRRALVKTVMNLRVPKNVGKFFSGTATGGFSRRTQLHGVSYFLYTSISLHFLPHVENLNKMA